MATRDVGLSRCASTRRFLSFPPALSFQPAASDVLLRLFRVIAPAKTLATVECASSQPECEFEHGAASALAKLRSFSTTSQLASFRNRDLGVLLSRAFSGNGALA